MLHTTPSSSLQVNSFLNFSNGVCTSNPSNIHHMLASVNSPNYIKGSRLRSVLSDLLGDGIFNADGDTWSLQRKLASHEFSTKSLKLFVSETVASELSNTFLPFLSEAEKENRVVDLQQSLNKLAFRIICRVGFGVNPEGFGLTLTGELDFMAAFDYCVETCFKRLTSPVPLLWKVKRFFKVGSEKRFRDSVAAIDDFALRVIAEKEKENDDNRRQDLLSRFMVWSSSLEFTGGEKQRNKFLRDIVISFVLAGKDATSTALTWFFWLIAGHPHVANSIYRQIEQEQFPLGYEELKRLDYLHAAISESMRLFPPVPHNSNWRN